ncbi:MAG: helix-turn-helix domain-containing protein [Prevotella sp.]|nr:helix-turn-helix domain-containing protein [Prevotella sp.]
MENSERNTDIEIRALKTRCTELERRLSGLENVVYVAKEYLTLEEAATFLGCTRSLLYKMTHLHTIPFYKPTNKLVYFERTELVDWIKRNRSLSDNEIEEQAHRVIQNLSTRKV